MWLMWPSCSLACVQCWHQKLQMGHVQAVIGQNPVCIVGLESETSTYGRQELKARLSAFVQALMACKATCPGCSMQLWPAQRANEKVVEDAHA